MTELKFKKNIYQKVCTFYLLTDSGEIENWRMINVIMARPFNVHLGNTVCSYSIHLLSFCPPIVIRFRVIAYFPVYIWSISRVFPNNSMFARVKPPFKIYWQMIYNFLERATKKSCTPYKQIYFPFLYWDSVYVFF